MRFVVASCHEGLNRPLFNAIARGKSPSAIKYRHIGMLASVGDNRSLADLPKYKGKGFTT